MSTAKWLIVLTVISVALSFSLFSQITLEGVVTDNGAQFMGNGAEPVANALVELTDQSNPSRYFSDYTDSEGKYVIQISETQVDDSPSQSPSPDAFKLFQNYPNPFNPSTVIAYEISRPSHIRIQIYNVIGQKIKTLFDGFQSQLSGGILWDATDDAGRGVPGGVYMYSLESGGIKITKKMLLIDGGQGGSTLSLSKPAETNNPLQKTLSNQYQLRVTGNDIETFEQNLEITGNTLLDVTVIRTLTDIDGNIYKTVKVGDQWWMAENLKVVHYRNGDAIPNVTDNNQWANLTSGAYCDYNNTAESGSTYGHLFNWFAVNDGRKIAPAGWHVPTDEDWMTLEVCLGMDTSVLFNTDFRGTTEGDKLKETGSSHWTGINTGATNESGFTAIPGGWRISGGGFYSLGHYSYFWSATSYDSFNAWRRYIWYSNSGIARDFNNEECAFSVRLVKD